HLPAPDQSNRSARPAPDDPREQLPVATRPSVVAGGGDPVMGWGMLEQFDVGDQTGTREQSLEEIVAQQRVLRHPSRQRRLEHVHVIDSLARVRALAPTSRLTAPRGSRVSESSVMTYRTSPGTSRISLRSPAIRAGLASLVKNVVSVAPRRRRFSSWSFPRLRSHPIHVCSLSFQS